MDATTKARFRHFHLGPDRFVLLLLAVECLLWLSERFGWLGWHKCYAILTAVASVGVAMLGMFVWFAVAVAFRRRFQFSLRSLLVLVVVVALPCSWLGTEIKKAKEQRQAVKMIEKAGVVAYDYPDDGYRFGVGSTDRTWVGRKMVAETIETIRKKHWEERTIVAIPFAEWIRRSIGDDFFVNVSSVVLVGPEVMDANLEYLSSLPQLRRLDLNDSSITDAGLDYLQGLNDLQALDLDNTAVTAEGIAKFQQALPNCKITR